MGEGTQNILLVSPEYVKVPDYKWKLQAQIKDLEDERASSRQKEMMQNLIMQHV
ncbi:hypothetical protein Lser_V15G11756 [Lactuca serriola]